eukprot:tig00021491_g21768.t1
MASLMKLPIVIDNGTGYTKMGYANNVEPNFVIPTVIALGDRQGAATRPGRIPDLDFEIGDEALSYSRRVEQSTLSYPVRGGLIENWDHMEKFWARSIFHYLKCEPEDHNFLLTEAPMNPPESREQMAEIMFETFNVNGLYIAVQAVLALYAGMTAKRSPGGVDALTGTVVDSGDGVTHVIPIDRGYVISTCIRSVPIAGRDITNFTMQLMRDRETAIPPEEALDIARRVKETYGYVATDLAEEFRKFDRDANLFKRFSGRVARTNQPWQCDVGYEQFLAPEIFFSPEISPGDYTQPLPKIIDEVIQSCPIDCRRGLYRNVVLSGGSCMFKGFRRRAEKNIQAFCDERFELNQKFIRERVGAAHQSHDDGLTSGPLEVKVIAPPLANLSYSVWYGGSYLATLPGMAQMWHSKEQYMEYGPSICRHNKLLESG